MNLFELFVKIGVDDQASSKLGNITSKLGGGLKTAAKIGTAAVGAAAGAIVALTKQAVENYAEYEQLVGGVETLFKNSADTVQQYAANAYKTAGLSANEYMSTVTSFSASLLQSLGGDTEAAAEYADMAITDMSDNANKMGTSMEMIQNAYQGFAKQNYTMLDNLKLGYGGTKEEMKRLLEDAEAISGIEYDVSSYADVVDAIHVIQTEMGIMGTTAKEASETISGSLTSTKSAWSNLVTGVADDNADFEKLIGDFVESVGVTAKNILPRIQTALEGAGKLVEQLVPVIIDMIPSLIEDTLPKLLKSGVNIIRTILDGIAKDPEKVSDTILNVIGLLIDTIIDLLPDILATGALLLGELAVGIIEAIPKLIARIPEIIGEIKDAFSSHSSEFSNIGDEIISGIWEGISNAWSWLKDKVSGFFSGIVDSAKETLGIHSPSTVFRDIVGKNIVLGVSEGIVKNQKKLDVQLEKTFTTAKKQSLKAVKSLKFEETGKTVVSQITTAIDKQKKNVENTADKLSSLIAKTMESAGNKTAWGKTATNLATTFKKNLTEGLQEIQKDAEAQIEAIAKDAQEKIDSVLKLRETLQNKLSDFGGLFIEDKDTGEITLTNLKKQTQQIKSYGEKLEKISGYFSEDLMSEIVGMSMEDSKKFVDYVSTLNGKELEEYNELYTKKMKAAKKVAETYYAPYITSIKTEYADKINEVFASLKVSLEEIGESSIEGFLKGFTSKNKSAKKEVNDFVNGLVASVKKQLGIKSPSRVFMDIANQMVNGLVYGWDKAIGTFEDDVTNSLEFGDGYIGSFGDNTFNASASGSVGGRPINITQNIYAQKKSAAQLMQEARWQAQMGVLANA
jgi:phage-related protein